MKSPRRSLGAALAVAALAATAGCATAATPSGDGDQTLTIAQVGTEAQDFDPNVALNYLMIAQPVYEPLFYSSETDAGISYAPVLAESWEFSDDFQSMTLEIRQGVTFSDGAKLDAQAVKDQLDYDLAIQGNIFTAIGVIGDEVVDDYTLRIDFDSTAGPERYLAFLACMSVASPEALKADPESLSTSPVGSGAYVLDEDASSPGVEYTFTRRDDYWDEDAFLFDTVVIKYYPDVVSAANALMTGQVDFAGIDDTTAGQVEDAGLRVDTQTGYVSGLTLGDRGGVTLPPLADVRVRQAINYAFDREAIAENVYNGFAEASNQAWNSSWPEYRDDMVDLYSYDPDKARDLLAEAGYPDGFDVIIPSAGDDPLEPVIQQSLADIGIRVTYDILPADALYTAMTTSTYAVHLLNTGFENTISYFLRKGATYSPWQYDDPEGNALIEKVNFGTPEESEEAAYELGKYVLDQAYYAPLVHPYLLWGVKPTLEIQYRVATANSPWLRDIKPAS